MKKVIRRFNPHLLLALAIALVYHGSMAFFTFKRTYDAYVHIFFADHYARSWFDPWDYRWYTGFPLTSYPPGSQQSIALLSPFIGLQNGFIVVMTFSIIPQLPHATEVAETAHARGYEVMVHLPMEPKGYPQRRLEQNGLLMSLSDEEIDKQLRRYLELVPHAAGANNHMGSRFTEDSSKMLPVMLVLKQRKLFFLDSKTTTLSVGYSLAHEVGLKSAYRNVFLDNVQEVGAIRAQLQQAAQIARKRGYAIAICHPHKATLEALAQVLPGLKDEGITFVKMSQVVE